MADYFDQTEERAATLTKAIEPFAEFGRIWIEHNSQRRAPLDRSEPIYGIAFACGEAQITVGDLMDAVAALATARSKTV